MWAGEATTWEDARVYRLSRIFESLRLAVAALDEYYDQVSKDPNIPALVDNEPHPRFSPHPTRFREYSAEATVEPKWIEFEYIDACGSLPTDLTFIGKVKSLDRKLVIKLVNRYGFQAHRLLADVGMTPQLFYCGLLDGKTDIRNAGSRAEDSLETYGLYINQIHMVVMEHIERCTNLAR